MKDVIGMGSQATVSLAFDKKTGERVAVKTYNVNNACNSLRMRIDAALRRRDVETL